MGVCGTKRKPPGAGWPPGGIMRVDSESPCPEGYSSSLDEPYPDPYVGVKPDIGVVEGGMSGAGGVVTRAAGLRRAAFLAAFLAGLALRAVFRRATFLDDAFFPEALRTAFFRRGALRFLDFFATVSPPLL